MSIRNIGENKTNRSLDSRNDAVINNRFAAAAEMAGDVRAIKFITEQFAAQAVSAAEPQDNLQKAARELIEKHTSTGLFGSSWLDNDGLGKELTANISDCPELVKSVFSQLGSGGKLYTAQTMLDNLNDEQLTRAAASAEGKQILSDIKQSFSANIEYQKSWGDFFASKDKVAADQQRIQRIDTALAKALVTDARKETPTEANVQSREIAATELPAGSNPEIRWELPEKGTGYVTYNRNDSGTTIKDKAKITDLNSQSPYSTKKVYDQIGTKETIERIQNLAAEWNTMYPNTPIEIGDMSLPGGVDTTDHKGHQNGKIIDIRPIRTDDKWGEWGHKGGSLTFPQSDVEKTKDLVMLILKQYPNAKIIYNDKRIYNDPKFKGKISHDPEYKIGTKSAVHDNHLHVEFP